MFGGVLDGGSAAGVHPAAGLVGLPETSRHLGVGVTGTADRELGLQGVVLDLGRVHFVQEGVQDDHAVVGVGCQARVFGGVNSDCG